MNVLQPLLCSSKWQTACWLVKPGQSLKQKSYPVSPCCFPWLCSRLLEMGFPGVRKVSSHQQGEGRSLPPHSAFEARSKAAERYKGPPWCSPKQLFQPAGAPRGKDESPQRQALRGKLEKTFAARVPASPATSWPANRPGPVLQHNKAISGSPMARYSFLPLRRNRSPHRTSRLAAVPQMGPRYWLGQWSLPWSTAHQQSPQTTGCLCRVPALVLPTSFVQAQPLGLHQHYLTKQALKTNGTTLLAPTLNTQTVDGRSCLACANS